MGLFGFLNNDNKRNLKKLTKYADKVEALSDKFAAMSETELKGQTAALKERLNNGATLDDILPEAFATVREASWRVLGMKHFYVQLVGGVCLHQGRIAEMRTGEGKTLVATLPVYLNALTGKGVHVVTVNEYLARRDSEWMGKVYNYLGLSVGLIYNSQGHAEKKLAYASDILYATNNELGFDYLRDNMAVKLENTVQRELNFAVVDEVDSILVDEARTPLIISGRGTKSSDMYVAANRFAKSLKPADYELDEEDKKIALTESGVAKAEQAFGLDNLSDIDNTETNHYINQAMRAVYIMKRDNDYIVENDEVLIVDENTGRVLVGRRYSEGLHQAIEAKEGVKIQNENKTLATITFQNFFRLYKKLSGMTGTAKTEEEEFNNIYKLDVVTIPTNLPTIRKDHNDMVYKTVAGKLRAVLDEISYCYEKKQPVLVGTVTVEKSEELSNLLRKRKIPHNVLNAKNHEQEAEIIAQAGKLGQITIATNMAGRGTDILLGGNPEYLAKTRMKKAGFSDEQIVQATGYASTDDIDILRARDEFKTLYDEYKKETDKEKELVKELGGLHILGTERHESRRIDNQLRGRSGRQGDPGSSVFFISTEDDLIRIFGGDKAKGMLERMFNILKLAEDEPIDMKPMTRLIENAQKRIEGRNFGMRKRVLQYDDVMNSQRSEVYSDRQKVLRGEDVHGKILSMIPDVADRVLSEVLDIDKPYGDWNFEDINKHLEAKLLPPNTGFLTVKMAENLNYEEILARLVKRVTEEYEKKIAEHKEQGLDYAEVERFILLKVVDEHWTEHIDAMDQFRKSVGLKGYAQQDPILYYKKEGYDMYYEMTDQITYNTVTMLLKIRVEQQNMERSAPTATKARLDNAEETATKRPQGVNKGGTPQISRNANCPCGSRKKYKHCCGKDS